jgi:hypothetical protein
MVKHRRDVRSGDLWACTASGFSRGQKSTVGGAGVWAGAGYGAQDVGVFDSTGLPAERAGEAAQTGAVGRRDRRHPPRRQDQTRQAATYGEADLRSTASGARLHGRLHDREGLCAGRDAALPGDVRSADARSGRGAGRLRRSAGDRGRSHRRRTTWRWICRIPTTAS